MYHGNKVYKCLSAVSFGMENQEDNQIVTTFKSEPEYYIHAHKEQFVIVSQKMKSANQEVINNNILIYKIFDSLMNAFPA